MKKCILFLLLFSTTLLFAEWTIVASYPIPEGASGLAYDGTYLYCGMYGQYGDQFYRIDPNDGSYQLQFSNPNIGDSFGMTWDGTNLWITDHVTSPSVPATAIELDISSGVILSQFDLPAHYMSGIAYDNGDFWVAAYYDPDGQIYKVDNTGAILQQFPAPDAQPWDLCLENDNLWMADYWGDALYKIDPITGTLLETHPSEGVDPAGIVWDGQYLWYCDNGQGYDQDYLYKVDLGGTGTPEIQLGFDQYDFGNTIIGQPASVELPVTNIGTADLSIDAMNFTLNDFYTDEVLPIIIPQGNTENLTIYFEPSTWGPFTCALTIESNDPVNPAEEVNLSGYGIEEDPQIVVSPNSLNYGSIRVGAITGRYIEISNQGSGTLEITTLDFDDTHFFVDDTVELPIFVAPTQSYDLRIWFSPDAAITYSGALDIHSNDPIQPIYGVDLNGSGNDSSFPIGQTLWQHQITTGYDNSPKAIAPIPDISGDGIDDVIICSEDNFVRCFNGNASVSGDILWETEIYSGNIYTQNSLKIIEDIDSDGYDDVIVGTTGGNRAINALSGKTGQLIWTFYTSIYTGTGGWVYEVDVSYDYNNDGILDVLAAAGSDAQRVMCMDGTNGNELWNFYAAGPKFSCIGIEDVTGDGIPDAIAGASNSNETDGKVFGIDGANGSQLWEFTTGGSSVWALAQVDDVNGDGIEDVAAGDFSGNYYCFDASNGSVLWSGSIGTCLILRFEKLEDVNSDGHPDIAIAHSSIDNAVVIDGYTGSNIWIHPVADQPWVVDKIDDISGDGINDVIVGTLFGSNFGYFLDGVDGTELGSINVGSAVDAIGGIPDIANDNSWEMVVGGRNGTVMCISGGIVEIPQTGFIEGIVTLNGGLGNITEVEITAGGVTVNPDLNGNYNLELDAGTYDITASLAGYQLFEAFGIAVIAGQITNLDITINFMFPPQNLTATIINYNSSILLEWEQPAGTPEVLSVHPRTKRINNNRESRMLLGYKIYRDGTEIAEILDPNQLTYEDLGPFAPSEYNYWVTVIYVEGESAIAEVVATVVLNPPENLAAMSSGSDVILTWEPPILVRGLSEYKIYKDDILIGTTTDDFYIDTNVQAGTYTYGVSALYDGDYESDPIEIIFEQVNSENTLIPVTTALIGNYPNPFNPETNISFSLKDAGNVSLEIYNVKGEKVRTLINGHLDAAYHNIIWNGKNEYNQNIASGVYFYKFKTSDYSKIRKMLLIK
ncbi:MAG: choice-of-anchor D domain-containing protein [Armatimonadetes bacterium]|nr:choice-of-anchor D domain-containing protein [Armatimonadota bacterium]